MASRDEALIADPAAAWDAAATAWDEFVETGLDYWRTEVHGPSLLAACGDVQNRTVLDLGCGQGWFSRQLAAHGAEVTGVDVSAAQLANALAHEAARPLGITYRHLDAALVATHWPPASFDVITACMALHDTPDTDRILAASRQVLVHGGRMAFSIVHPVAGNPHASWEVGPSGEKGARKFDHYFASGPYVLNWTMARLTTHWATPQWHRTLEEWSELIADAGFVIARLHEPRPTPAQVARNLKLAPATRVPFFLIFELRQIP